MNPQQGQHQLQCIRLDSVWGLLWISSGLIWASQETAEEAPSRLVPQKELVVEEQRALEVEVDAAKKGREL